MKTALILTLATFAILTNSCKKDKCDQIACDLAGKYTVDVNVTKRIPYLFNSTSIPDFSNIKVGDLVFYDTTDVCCEYRFVSTGHKPYLKQKIINCPLPLNYKLFNAEIVNNNGKLFLKSSNTDQNVFFDLPISTNNNKITYSFSKEGNSDILNKPFIFSMSQGVSSDLNWLVGYSIKWVSLELSKEKHGVYKGKWIFVHTASHACEFLISGMGTNNFLVTEFAEVTFTKLK
jgi:hypothetical protein